MKQPRETITGTSEGIDFQSALENAINKAGAPSPGFSIQYYSITSHKIEHGGFIEQMKTYVTIDVFDGAIEN